MPAIVRSIEVDTASVFVFVRDFVKPRAEFKLLAGFRVHPNLAVVYITGNVRRESFPPFDFARRGRQTAVTVFLAAFTTLIALFHAGSGRDFALGINHLPMAYPIAWCAG